MIIADRYIIANDISEAWLDALQYMIDTRQRTDAHLVIRVKDPTIDRPEVRSLADRLIADYNSTKTEDSDLLWPVDSTRNTIFPATWASRHAEPSELADYYRLRYKALKQIRASQYGTYFGRVVAYPREAKHSDGHDQLSAVVDKLRNEHGREDKGSKKSSCYEINIYSERYDTNRMSFPCLAHISLHVHDGKLHMQAVYRNEILVGRAYGNYWGLAQLQTYIAAAVPALRPGELMLTLNHVELDRKVPLKLIKGVLSDAQTA